MGQPKEKVNILFIIIQMGMGGSERLVHDLALNIDRKLFNPSIAWFFCESILDEFSDLKIPLYYVPKMKRIDLFTMNHLANIIKKNNIHIVNAHHFMSMVYTFYGCKIRNKVKFIYTEHSKWQIKRISWKWRKAGKYLLNHVDSTVGVNSGVTEAMKNTFNLSQSKLLTIRNGVNLKAFSKHMNQTIIKKELNIYINCKIIGIVANLKKVKNHIFLLNAFNVLVQEIKDVKLLIIGQAFNGDSDNSEPEIRSYIKNEGLNNSVSLLGYRSDVSELLSIMDIFCLTSLKEGLPISMLEAMASGLPLVGTSVEGIRDVIVQDKNGFLVKSNDVIGLKNALTTLLKDEPLRNRMGKESLSMATRMYSLDRCVKQYQDLFISVLDK